MLSEQSKTAIHNASLMLQSVADQSRTLIALLRIVGHHHQRDDALSRLQIEQISELTNDIGSDWKNAETFINRVIEGEV